MNKIAIRLSTLEKFGYGHISRCLNIRKYMNAEVSWFVDNESSFIQSLLPSQDKIFIENNEKSCSKLIEVIEQKCIRTVLIDSYRVPDETKRKLCKITSVVIIDDKDITLKADIIFCSQPINMHDNDSIKHYGPKYAPISREFNKKLESKLSNNNILISMGSRDNKGITLSIINSLFNIVDYHFQVTIVLGKEAPFISKIREIIKYKTNFHLIVEPKNMNEIYQNHTFAIGAPGLSHMERLYVGLPSILIPQNEEHKTLINNWYRLGCCLKADNNINSIELSIKKLISNSSLRDSLINNGMQYVDGKGSERIANKIQKLMAKHD